MRKRLLYVSALFLVFTCLIISACQGHIRQATNQFSAEEWRNQGLSYLNSKHYEKAIKAFSKALEIDPSPKLKS